MAYDCVVVGGGHNGLVCAAYLGRAGRRVLVLERRHVLGGCASTEELWPGFRVSPAAYVISLFLPRIIEELSLREHGLEILPRDPSAFTPLPDGRSLVLGRDRAANAREIARFSPADAVAYPRYEAFLTRVAEVVEPLLMEPPPEFPPGLPPRLRDLGFWWRAWRALDGLGSDLHPAVELLTGTANRLLDRWFESEPLKATLATDAIIGAFLSPSSPGSAYVLLHHVMGEAGGARGVWGYVRGGMGGLAEALGRACRSAGVEIRREAEVASIEVEGPPGDARVRGVTLAGGGTVEADVVASGVDATRTMLGLLGRDRLPEAYADRVGRIDYASASVKLNLALDGLPRFEALERRTDAGKAGASGGTGGAGATDGDPAAPLRGTIHIAPDRTYIERAYDDAKYGRPSREPVLEITLPSTVDDTLAPPGKHVLSMFVQYAPYRLTDAAERPSAVPQGAPDGSVGRAGSDRAAGGPTPAPGGEEAGPSHGWTEDGKEAFADRCLEVLERYAPGVRERVLHRQVLAPPDLERVYGLTGGNIFQGAMSLEQLGPFRTPYRTPVKGLWLCGAATHPGGGVMGACGLNAAREILRG